MKKLIIILTATCGVLPGLSQKWAPELGANLVYSSPSWAMKNTIARAFGGTFFVGATGPSKRITTGLEVNLGNYGNENSVQAYSFPDGTTADMDIRVNNNFTALQGVVRLNLLTGKSFIPFVVAKMGYAWYQTSLNIYDPDDQDSCSPVERDILKRDGALQYTLGAGIEYDLAKVFWKLPHRLLYLSVQSSINRGGRVSYMNSDAPTIPAQHGATRSDLEASFIDTQTQVVHMHHVGYVYTSYIGLIDFRLGVTVRPGRLF
jgi:hypothetical protein